MKEFLAITAKFIFHVIFPIVFVIAFVFGLGYLGYVSYEFYAPRYNAVDRKVFEESQSYNDGMRRDLENMRMDYYASTATPEQRAMIRATVIHRFAGYDPERLPPDLRNFLRLIMG